MNIPLSTTPSKLPKRKRKLLDLKGQKKNGKAKYICKKTNRKNKRTALSNAKKKINLLIIRSMNQ